MIDPALRWRLVALAWPVALQGVLAAAFALVDTLMVASQGAAAMGGVGLVGRLYMFFGMALGGLAGAVGLLATQRLRSAPQSALAATGAALWLSVLTLPWVALAAAWPQAVAGGLAPDAEVVGAASEFLRYSAPFLFFSALAGVLGAHARALGDTRRPLLAGLLALGVNTLINVLFIEGRWSLPGFGVAAAGAGAALGRLLECIWLWRSLDPQTRAALAARCAPPALREVVAHALPLATKELVWAGGTLAFALLIARLGPTPLAAFNLVLPIEGLLISGVFGVAIAAGIVLGQQLGQGDFSGARDAAAAILAWLTRWVMVASLLLALVLAVLLVTDSRWPGVEPQVGRLALQALLVFSVGFAAKAHNTLVAVGILRCGGDNAWILWVDLCSMWLFSVPLVAIAVLLFQWPLAAVFALMLAEEVVKVALFRRRVRAGRWLRRV